MTSFREFLHMRLETGGFSTEDALASFLPLARQVAAAHERELVAPLRGVGALAVDGITIWFAEGRCAEPRRNRRPLLELQRPESRTLEVVGVHRTTQDVDGGGIDVENLEILLDNRELDRPVYLPGYVVWEHRIDHHDPITDIFSLGLVLASLACGLDFHDPEDLSTFVTCRGNLFRLVPGLHPVLAQAIVQMTELNRHRRPQDLAALIHSLENYRDQEVDLDFDLARVEGFGQRDLKGKHGVVLARLQERLFETSRRNRLLHFRPTMQTINLTQSSVPLSFDVRSIRPDHLLTWSDRFQAGILGGSPVSLNRYINFDEVLYAPAVLSRIRAEARRDENEFGFAQLRLVLCFLRWANLKEKPHERFDSPLVLLPVKLTRKKGVRDSYLLEALDTTAEVNPVVRHSFKKLYDIDLPETLDLAQTDLDQFHAFFEQRIRASDPSVELAKIDRPRIAVIHAKARRRLDQYQRRARIARRAGRTFSGFDYSYVPGDFRPLGFQLFQTYVRPPVTSTLRTIVETAPRRSHMAAAPVAEKSQTLFQVKEAGDDNPHRWEFDLCRVTLGNFKYRKMSLVRDYDQLLEERPPNPAFDSVFSLAPRETAAESPPSPPWEDRYHVVSCDPTQASAIHLAHQGKSYIIQGPPGTGKSQTITNLIADAVARGRRVLFVCEKRAAIDVVYHRLRQCGLHRLCCLIHDAQADKKAFIADLKETYETFLADESVSRKARSRVIASLEEELAQLREVHRAMTEATTESGVAVREVLSRAIQLRGDLPDLDALQKERLPFYAQWVAQKGTIDRFAAALSDVQPDGVLARHPLGGLTPRLAALDRPLETVTRELKKAREHLAALRDALDGAGGLSGGEESVVTTVALLDHAAELEPFARSGELELLPAGSARARELETHLEEHRRKKKRRDEAKEKTSNWRELLPREEVETALGQARGFEGSFLSFLSPAWWRLRKVLRHAYDFGANVMKPSWTQVLESLKARYEAEDEEESSAAGLRSIFRFEGDVLEFVRKIEALRARVQSFTPAERAVHERWLSEPSGATAIVTLAAARHDGDELTQSLDALLDAYGHLAVSELGRELDGIRDALDQLPDFLAVLEELAALSPELRSGLRELDVAPAGLEAAIASRTLEQVYRHDRVLKRFDGAARKRAQRRLDRLVAELYEANATEVLRRVQEGFLENVRRASLPAAQLDDEGKKFKKRYNRGRRVLEHEFGKTMRYKSIRDLSDGEPGLVVRDLKPVWLMSPLSVSDTLPLDPGQFDLVVFDEASQVTLEEAVPSVFRARQVIVVGDEMQLPPTNFFSAKRGDEESLLWFEEGDELVEYDLGANSFLSHAARNLSSKMLGWHYRSRSESLISFSNWAFYDGDLLTVPEETIGADSGGEIRAASAAAGRAGGKELVSRPLSFHFMENGVYQRRRNRAEADYIAAMVQELLESRPELSIGIVAFSEAQQEEIESALERLAEDDAKFRGRLETAYEREEDGQFIGLLVKNLENIQGDERDVIILSICYGHGLDGRMIMNFGPINKTGGEKRLNVAFSRAKRHMAVVSSIRHTHITNDYNDGANCLRNYLRYADAASRGDETATRRVLGDLSLRRRGGEEAEAGVEPVTEALAAALRDRGWQVDTQVGHSRFRCNLAIRRAEDRAYRCAVLVDGAVWYEESDLVERELMKPKLLETFGWRLAVVLSKDFYRDPDGVVATIEKVAAGESGGATEEETGEDTGLVT